MQRLSYNLNVAAVRTVCGENLIGNFATEEDSVDFPEQPKYSTIPGSSIQMSYYVQIYLKVNSAPVHASWLDFAITFNLSQEMPRKINILFFPNTFLWRRDMNYLCLLNERQMVLLSHCALEAVT